MPDFRVLLNDFAAAERMGASCYECPTSSIAHRHGVTYTQVSQRKETQKRLQGSRESKRYCTYTIKEMLK